MARGFQRFAILVLACSIATGSARAQSSPPGDNPPLPPPRPSATDEPVAPQPDRHRSTVETGGPNDNACTTRLARLGVAFEPRPPIQESACGGTDIVILSGLPDGLTVSPPATMRCPVAEALARWTLESLSAEADRHLGAALTKVLIGTSYECRDQRNGAKLSEHAFADGVDVMGFEFAKHAAYMVGFPAPNTPEAEFQNAVRQKACTFFTTVLGPGSDPDHSNHLHLDLRARKAGYRICQ